MRTLVLSLIGAVAFGGCSVITKTQAGCASQKTVLSQLWTKDILPEAEQRQVNYVTPNGWQRLAVDKCAATASTDTAADDTLHDGDPDSGTGNGTPPPGGTDTGTGGNQLVIFRIPDGTGTGPWNSAADMVQVRVNDTLRVCNDDVTTGTLKRMHANGRPFAHGNSDIAPGQCRDYLIRAATNTSDRVYNHHVGTAARLYIVAAP